jgi:Uma2 family endonuclease
LTITNIGAVTPELIIEVVSSSNTKEEGVKKFDLYQQEG